MTKESNDEPKPVDGGDASGGGAGGAGDVAGDGNGGAGGVGGADGQGGGGAGNVPGPGQIVSGISSVIAPVSLLTGIAFYFGWQRVAAFDGYFGLNVGAVGNSTNDYVLNSLNPLFLPVLVVLVALIAFAFAHALVNHVHATTERPERLRRVANWTMVVGVVVFLVGALAVFEVFPVHVPYLIGAFGPAVGVVLFAYGVSVRRRLSDQPPLSTGLVVLVGLFVAISLFAAAGLYAGTVGREQAARLAARLGELPGAQLYSSGPLPLPPGYGLVEAESPSKGPYNYRGLRVLAVVNGNLYLVPCGWSKTNGATLIVLPEQSSGDPAYQLAFTPPSQQIVTGSSGGFVAAVTGSFGFAGLPNAAAPPGLAVTGKVTPARLHVGDTPTLAVTVTNLRVRGLSHVVVSSPQAPDCNAALGSMAVGDHITYSCALPSLTAATSADLKVAGTFKPTPSVTATTDAGLKVNLRPLAPVTQPTPGACASAA
jgi:hypothetical protein